MSSFGETNVNNYNLDSMDYAHDTQTLFAETVFKTKSIRISFL